MPGHITFSPSITETPAWRQSLLTRDTSRDDRNTISEATGRPFRKTPILPKTSSVALGTKTLCSSVRPGSGTAGLGSTRRYNLSAVIRGSRADATDGWTLPMIATINATQLAGYRTIVGAREYQDFRKPTNSRSSWRGARSHPPPRPCVRRKQLQAILRGASSSSRSRWELQAAVNVIGSVTASG